MDKPLVFTASCADEANPNILADGDQSDKDDGIQMEAMEVSDNKIPKLPSIKTPLRESTNEKSVTKGNLGDIIAATSLNVSKAMLKWIDPKIRLSKKGREEGPSPNPKQNEDQMVQEVEADPSSQVYQDVLANSMQVEEAGESPASE